MRKLLLFTAFLASYAGAQTISPSQIKPSTTNGYVIKTVSGVAVWAPGGTGCVPSVPVNAVLYSPTGTDCAGSSKFTFNPDFSLGRVNINGGAFLEIDEVDDTNFSYLNGGTFALHNHHGSSQTGIEVNMDETASTTGTAPLAFNAVFEVDKAGHFGSGYLTSPSLGNGIAANTVVGFQAGALQLGTSSVGKVYGFNTTNIGAQATIEEFAFFANPLETASIHANYCDFMSRTSDSTPVLREAIGCGPTRTSTFNGPVTVPDLTVTGTCTGCGGGGTPGGSTTQIQYNNAGAFGGDSGFTTDGAGHVTAKSVSVADGTGQGGTFNALEGTVGTLTPTAAHDILYADATAHCIQYSANGGAFACLGAGGGGSAFSAITGGTNTTAGMLVGSGASLAPTGTGTIQATNISGTISNGSGIGLSGAGTVASPYVLSNTGTGNTTSTSLTTGFLPKANGANSIINSSVDDGATTVGVVTSSKPIAVSGSTNGELDLSYTGVSALTPPNPGVQFTVNSAGRPTFNPNASGALLASGISSSAVSGNCAKFAANGIDLLDAGAACGAGGGLPAYIQPSTAVPTVASLTAVNQSTSTATDTAAGIYMVQPSTATQYVFGLFHTTPGATWTYTTAIEAPIFPTSGIATGVCITDGTKIITFGAEYNGGAYPSPIIYYVTKWNSATSYNSDYTSFPGFPLNISSATAWYRIQDDGTNLTYSVSYDGVNFVQVKQTLRADFLTTASIGACLKAQNAAGTPAIQTVSSWKATTP